MTYHFRHASRLDLPVYPFADLERKAAELISVGKRIYDLSIGDPDLPPPSYIVEAAREALADSKAHRYPSSRGDFEIRKAVAQWVHGRFGIDIDPDSQVCILIGAKEGLAQFARAVVNPGDCVAVPDPSYPVYSRAGCQLVEGRLRTLELKPERAFLPDLNEISDVKLLYLNYPHNPTGAIAPESFMRELAYLIEAKPEMTLAYDMAYSELCYDLPAHSMLEYTTKVVEFHSLSKMANATGYRIGFAIGDPERISALIRAKEEMDSGVPYPFQRALLELLNRYNGKTPPPEILASKAIYRKRKDKLARALENLGFTVFRSPATFYVWFKAGDDELEFVDRALESGVLFTPGSGFGRYGKGWVRASVTAPDEVIDGAIDVIKTIYKA